MLKLEIVTPYGLLYENEQVDMVIARGIEGEFGVLENMIGLVTPLQISVVKIHIDGEVKELTISGGYLSNKDNHVIIVANSAEWCSEIDLKRAEAAYERAKKRLESPNEDIDEKRAKLAMTRALNRINNHK